MTKLLYINSSPRGEQSESRAIAGAFLDSYKRAVPDLDVELLDLWTDSLPVYGARGVEAKMSVFAGVEPAGDAADAWDAVQGVFARFSAADEYLFTVPMWNHGIPWVLKHFIDTVSQPGMVFGFDPNTGYSGLLMGKRAVVVYTSAVYYEGATRAFGSDFHRSYFNDWLRWAGVTDVDEVRFQPNLVVADAQAGRDSAIAQARNLGLRYAQPRAIAA
jgi:FMN-dependent NADH-azoreductase